jgi:hypothetical protein
MKQRRHPLLGSIAALSASLVFVCVAAGLNKTHREREGLIGPVSKVVEESGTWKPSSPIFSTATTYDRAGNMTESEEARYQLGAEANKEKIRTIYERDGAGRIAGLKSYGGDGALMETRRHAYDSKGNLIEEAFFRSSGKLMFKFVSVYDASGNTLERRSYGDNGALESKSTFTYDTKGNVLSMSYFKDCTTEQSCKILDYRAVSTYDAQNRLTESALYKGNGSLDERGTYSYNPKGYVQERIVYDGKGALRTKESSAYEYDSVGNWTKRTKTSKNMEGTSAPDPHITKRTITYYK